MEVTAPSVTDKVAATPLPPPPANETVGVTYAEPPAVMDAPVTEPKGYDSTPWVKYTVCSERRQPVSMTVCRRASLM
jgi:hypothetical protein